jgi:hypothetical protein
MGKQNVQNLISFYLNADMYRQFALKELTLAESNMKSKSSKLNNGSSTNADTSSTSLNLNKLDDFSEVKSVLKDFAKGLINLYLLNAVYITATNSDEVKI